MCGAEYLTPFLTQPSSFLEQPKGLDNRREIPGLRKRGWEDNLFFLSAPASNIAFMRSLIGTNLSSFSNHDTLLFQVDVLDLHITVHSSRRRNGLLSKVFDSSDMNL